MGRKRLERFHPCWVVLSQDEADMRRLTREEIEHLCREWSKTRDCPVAERDAFHDRLADIACTIAFPVGELMNPELEGYVWVLKNFKGIPKPGPITDKYNFDTHGLECCIEIEHEDLAHALLLWRDATTPYRINIFVKGTIRMSDFVANVISVTKVRHALKQLLATYLSEKEENRRDDDAHGTEYWDSACQTIKDVAAVLNIPLETRSQPVFESE